MGLPVIIITGIHMRLPVIIITGEGTGYNHLQLFDINIDTVEKGKFHGQ